MKSKAGWQEAVALAAAAGCTAPPAMAEASCSQHQQAGVEHVKA